MAKIRYENVSLKFEQNIVLDKFSLQVEEGEKVLISGKSGKGKSTLLRLLLGFQTYDSGKIYVDDVEISEGDMFTLRKKFAYVNQDVTLRQGKVAEVLEEVAKFSGNDFNGVIDKVLCEHFEFGQVLFNKTTQELSGGERQRLGIMLAISLNPSVYLLDEVTSALDAELKGKVVEYFSGTDKTVVSISHDSVWSDGDRFRKVEW